MVLIEEYVAAAHAEITAEGTEPDLSENDGIYTLAIESDGMETSIVIEKDMPAIVEAKETKASAPRTVALEAANASNSSDLPSVTFVDEDGKICARSTGTVEADAAARPKATALADFSEDVSWVASEARRAVAMASSIAMSMWDAVPDKN